jgi:NAD(P)-dependent dehydrogenase (short-subunit alcohol dehydrogenase family)
LKATKPFWEQDLEDVDTVMDVNVRGLMHITRKCISLTLFPGSFPVAKIRRIVRTDGVLRYHMMKRSPQPTGTVLFVSSITGK